MVIIGPERTNLSGYWGLLSEAVSEFESKRARVAVAIPALYAYWSRRPDHRPLRRSTRPTVASRLCGVAPLQSLNSPPRLLVVAGIPAKGRGETRLEGVARYETKRS